MQKILASGFAVLCLLFIVACSGFTTGASIAVLTGQTIDVSQQIDKLQAELGAHSNNQLALTELDRIQSDLSLFLMGDIGNARLEDLRDRSEVVYQIFRAEIAERWDEIPPMKQQEIRHINGMILTLSDDIEEFLSDQENHDIAYTASTLLDYGYYSLKIYDAYKEAL